MSRCNDYCCNHGCEQGRNCPARSTPLIVKQGGNTVETNQPYDLFDFWAGIALLWLAGLFVLIVLSSICGFWILAWPFVFGA